MINDGTDKKVLAYILVYKQLFLLWRLWFSVYYYDNTNSHNGKWYRQCVVTEITLTIIYRP